jgi:hypothetical protein
MHHPPFVGTSLEEASPTCTQATYAVFGDV